MRELLSFLGINIDLYPFDKIESLPVSGSSQVSKKDGAVTWNPIRKAKNFKPVGKWLDWDMKKKIGLRKLLAKR